MGSTGWLSGWQVPGESCVSAAGPQVAEHELSLQMCSFALLFPSCLLCLLQSLHAMAILLAVRKAGEDVQSLIQTCEGDQMAAWLWQLQLQPGDSVTDQGHAGHGPIQLYAI